METNQVGSPFPEEASGLITKVFRILFAVIMLVLGTVALGQDLAVNSGFTSAVPGWTSSGPVGAGYLGDSGGLRETLAANPGDRYTVSFLLAGSQGTGPNYYAAQFGASSMKLDNFGASFGWGGYDLTPVTGDGLNDLSIRLRDGAGFWFLDDMALSNPGHPVTPEPGTIILFASGLLSLVGLGRRKLRF